MATDERRLLAAKRLCSGRTRRREEFPEDMFGDWAWSMLMLTYIAQCEARTETPTALFAAAGVSEAVGRRWLAYLAEQGLVETGEGAVRPTADAVARLGRYLDLVIDLASGEAPLRV